MTGLESLSGRGGDLCKIEGKRLKLYSQEKHQSSFFSFSVVGNVIKHLHSNYFVATNGMICMGYRYSAGEEEGYERYFKAKNRYLIGNKLSTSKELTLTVI